MSWTPRTYWTWKPPLRLGEQALRPCLLQSVGLSVLQHAGRELQLDGCQFAGTACQAPKAVPQDH
jgi:hypothetical protein